MQTKIQDKLKKEFQKVYTEDEKMKEAGEAFVMQRLIKNATEEVESKIRGEVISSKEYPAEITKAEENTPFDVERESNFSEELTNGKARKFFEEMSKKEKQKNTLFAEMDCQ